MEREKKKILFESHNEGLHLKLVTKYFRFFLFFLYRYYKIAFTNSSSRTIFGNFFVLVYFIFSRKMRCGKRHSKNMKISHMMNVAKMLQINIMLCHLRKCSFARSFYLSIFCIMPKKIYSVIAWNITISIIT